ncbi:Dyp-type peroxidase [Pontiellaceae bacterium B12219]|nr:Dyp-type peroxidase [Pontiellaceae bacterium B12219]
MKTYQSGISAPIPAHGRYMLFSIKQGASPARSLVRLADRTDGDSMVVGLGKSLTEALGIDLPTLGTFPVYAAASVDVPSTPAALWCWLRGDERGLLINESRAVRDLIADDFECINVIDGFKHGSGRDLSGYEDGTENPKDEEALKTAFVQQSGEGLDGSSFAAVQTWVHNLNRFKQFPQDEQDRMIGRRISDNEELDDAPPSAHTKRTEQESFSPEAFVLRRSMPWADAYAEGLNFVAFGKDFSAFEAQLARMIGAEDGITDALFNFSKPVSGSYFWCPPMADGKLDLQLLKR